MLIGVPVERAPGERRVALTPSVVKTLVDAGHEFVVESGAGSAAGLADTDYTAAGARIGDPAGAALVARVGPPTVAEISAQQEGTILIGFLEPFTNLGIVNAAIDRKLTAFAMEAVPRTTLAQSMDALSSQSTAAGYQAVLLAASESPSFFPMLTTAAGTIPPAKVLILGVGVAGLQAIATARRLGAVVSAYDIRPETKEQVESLGARFVGGPTEKQDGSGYAAEVAEDTQQRQLDALAPHVAASDVVVTTAQIPGRDAPLLVSAAMVRGMKPGSIIVDLAAPSGGNCEVTKPGESIDFHGVTVLGPLDLASRVARDASQMYARNVAAFLARLAPGGDANIDLDDEIIGGTCVVHEGRAVHPRTRSLLGLDDA